MVIMVIFHGYVAVYQRVSHIPSGDVTSLWTIPDKWRFLAGNIICKWAMYTMAMWKNQRVNQPSELSITRYNDVLCAYVLCANIVPLLYSKQWNEDWNSIRTLGSFVQDQAWTNSVTIHKPCWKWQIRDYFLPTITPKMSVFTLQLVIHHQWILGPFNI